MNCINRTIRARDEYRLNWLENATQSGWGVWKSRFPRNVGAFVREG